MNIITLTGNLVADPETRFTGAGGAVTNFRIAHTPRRRNADGTYSDGETIFISCVLWGRELKATKGQRVVVSGALVAETWEPKDGPTRTEFKINAASVSLDTIAEWVEKVGTPVAEDDAPPF